MFPGKEGDKVEESARDHIRSLLKEFGVRADEAIVTHLAKNEDIEHLYLRIMLEDLTPYDELIFVRIPFCLRYDRTNCFIECYPKSALSGYDFAFDEGYDMLRQKYRNYNTKYAESL